MAVSASAVGAVPFTRFAKSSAPLVEVLRQLGHRGASVWIAGAALVALPSVILVDMYAQSRIFFVMSRDGLLPRSLSQVNQKLGTPVVMTLLTGVFVAVVAGLAPLDRIAEVANSGTLAAFTSVAVAMMVLRVQRPDLPRIFKCPAWWLVGPLAIAGCLYLFISLPTSTKLMFVGWNCSGSRPISPSASGTAASGAAWTSSRPAPPRPPRADPAQALTPSSCALRSNSGRMSWSVGRPSERSSAWTFLAGAEARSRLKLVTTSSADR